MYKWKPSKSSKVELAKKMEEIVAFIATFFIAKTPKNRKNSIYRKSHLSPKSRVNINICNNHNSNYYLIN